MRKILLAMGALFFLGTSVHAEMKCAPGKCGGSMKSDTKQEAKYILKANSSYQAIDIKAKEYRCSQCKMFVKKLDYATQAVKQNGDTYFFDDIGCMVKWLKNDVKDIVKMYVKSLDTHRWIEVQKAHYSRIAPSPMGYGFAALEKEKEGLISFEEVKTYILNDETLRNPAVKKQLLGE
jgi:hypothetical protein